MPLKIIIYESPSSRMFRRGIMATQLLATLTTVHHLPKGGVVVYLENPRHLFHSIPLDVCLVPQLERCCYVSFRELILSCSISKETDLSRAFPSLPFPMFVKVLRARHRDKDGGRINVHFKCNLDREDCVSCVPLRLTLRLNLGSRFLFSGGELSHPWSCYALG